MTPEELEALIRGGETFTVEFKGEERTSLGDSELVEGVVCLANGDGGFLLVGVEDDGRVTGARPRHGDSGTDPRRVEALVSARTRPALPVRCDVITVRARQVLCVTVPESAMPVGTSDGRYLRRATLGRGEPGCLPMHFYEMQSRQATRGALDYSALEVPGASWLDLDPLEFERFRRLLRESGGRGDSVLVELPDIELAKSLGVVKADHEVRAILVAGLLIFGREDALGRLLPAHEVAFQVLAQTQVEANDFFRWPLPRLMEELLARFAARNNQQEVLVGSVRVGVPDYSDAGFREAVANALVHRDYQHLGAVHVQWRDESLEISNPGGFPSGVREDNLLVTAPRPRNPLLADALKRAGLVERTGRGVDAIFEGQLRYGRPSPDYGRSSQEQVTVVLPGGRANLALTKFIVEQERAGASLTVGDLLIINYADVLRQVSVGDVASLIQQPEGTARALLNRLVERGILEARGSGRNLSYHFSSRIYRALGGESRYVRAHGLEPIQHEQMVLQYVDTYGVVSRSAVAELTSLTGDQAKQLLRRLVADGRLRLQGHGRGAVYVLGDAAKRERHKMETSH